MNSSKIEPVLYLVLPCFNEEETLNNTIELLNRKIIELTCNHSINEKSKMLFVDDGSVDKTWRIIREAQKGNDYISGISLSKNRGHQTAVLAGLLYSKDMADIVISIDADLQQDINAIDLMIEKYNDGCDIVFGVRNDRGTDGLFKKLSALAFYKLMNDMGCETIQNHADYRLLSKRAIESLSEYGEVNLFLRGLIMELGYKTDIVHFDVQERKYGKSKYNFAKMMRLAVDGITSFSIKPLLYITITGFVSIIISILMVVFTIVNYFMGNTVSGWATVVCSIWFLGGVQQVSLGMLGLYLGKNYVETKKRPRYHIKEILR